MMELDNEETLNDLLVERVDLSIHHSLRHCCAQKPQGIFRYCVQGEITVVYPESC